MKKFLFALIVSLLVTATSHAEIQTFTGTDEYTVGETETQADAKERSRLRALRNAQEQAGVLIKSRSRMKDLELVDDEVVTIAAAVLKVVGAPDYKVRVLDDGKSTLIQTTITVQIDTDDVDRRLKTIEARENPKPPVDKPKPIEQPVPQPVEKPKPEKVEPPTEKIEQPVEEPAPSKLPAPEYGIKFFVGYGNRADVVESAKDMLQRKMVAFVMEYCAKQNLKITEDEALAAVDYSSKVLSIRPGGYYWKETEVKGQINMRKLNEWLEQNFLEVD